jgi:O-antigen/teichoic acid export membrane protein
MSNTRKIARNSGWYGLETVMSAILGFVTSIVIARTLGPTKMSYIIYVIWIASVVASLGGVGIPATTRKYMAEFIGKMDRGTARYIFIRTLWIQMALATVATAGLLVWVLQDSTSAYRIASALVVLSIWPSMVNSISAQANVATEELATNLPASVLSMLSYFVAILATVYFKWGVIGVGASMLIMRLVDFLVRLFPTMTRILSWEAAHSDVPELRRRMLSFSWQAVASMVVALIVWDRSELFLLEHLCKDVRQVSFYSVAFNMAEKLLIGSTIFGSAAGATIFAQYGRDKSKLPALAASTFRYLALFAIPLHLIATALAVPALLMLYGNQYAGAATVVALAPILCMPKAFIGPVESLLQSNERQRFVIGATLFAGMVDIGVAWWLIRSHGAVGACIGSGCAQFTAIAIMWGIGIKLYDVKLPWVLLAKVSLISVAASLTAYSIASRMAPLWGILLGGSAAMIVLVLGFRFLRVLEPEDHQRIGQITRLLPRPISAFMDRVFPMEAAYSSRP